MHTSISNQQGVLTVEGAIATKPGEVCEVLRTHNISLCAMSETRWKGSGSIAQEDYVFLFSGLPETAPKSMYGVAFALNTDMQRCWKEAGSYVDYINERMIKIRLQIEGRVFNVVSVYAPTFRAQERDKEAFYEELRRVAQETNANEELIIMGDFNARVGTRALDVEADQEGASDLVLGDFGMNERNENGRLLVDFCRGYSRCPLRIMSTFYKHNTYGTWQHNRTKQWHQIDHVLASRHTAALFTNVKVMAGLDFDTDHRLVRTSLRVMKRCRQRTGLTQYVQITRSPKLNLSMLQDPVTREHINTGFAELVSENLTDCYELWAKALRKVGEAVLDVQLPSRRPQWQMDHAEELALLAKTKATAYAAMDGSDESRIRYKRVCKNSKKQVRQILNRWWTNKAQTIQTAVDRKDPNHQFKGFRELRAVFGNGKRAPCRIRDKKGNILNGKPERLGRWKEYFEELLNVETEVSEDRIGLIARVEQCKELGHPPTFAETLAAISTLNKGKAHGPDGIPAELLDVLSPALKRTLHEIICQIWTGAKPMPKEWKESYLIPLPKKGDLTYCKKWRGILLTSVPGKVFAKIINGRLVAHIECKGILPETQCGFRAGRGTVDMIFTLRMALELARVKKTDLHVVFVDLMKAYDSVNRNGLWGILRAKGVPNTMLDLIKDFYTGKTARVSAEGELTEEFELRTGLGQGCCLAPLLFNVYLAAVMEEWYHIADTHLTLPYRIDGILRRHMDEVSLNKYATWDHMKLSDLGYADDAAFLTDTYEKLVTTIEGLQALYKQWGLTMSVEKTEALVSQGELPPPIKVEETDGFDKVYFKKNFEYLGADVSTKQGCEDDITLRIDKARKAFWRLASSVWDVTQLSLTVKMRVYRACVISVPLYGCETWTTTFRCRKKLEQFQMMCLRKISKIGIWNQEQMHVNNGHLRAWLGVPTVCDMIVQARTRWLGHVARMNNARLPKQMLFAFFPGSVGVPTQVGRRTGKWLAFDFVNDLEKAGIPISGWMQIARKNNGSEWRDKVFQIARWYTPKNPKSGQETPDRKKEKVRGAPHRNVKRTFVEHAKNQQEWLDKETFHVGVLKAEQELGGRDKLISRILNDLQAKYGPTWMDMKEEDVVIDMTEEWNDLLVNEVDVGLLSMLVHAARSQVISEQGTPPSQATGRRRLRCKQPAPSDPGNAELEGVANQRQRTPSPPPAPPPAPPQTGVRVRLKRYGRQASPNRNGSFPCSLCSKSFDTKVARSSHVRIVHPEGTFRENGFQCELCPRLFLVQGKLTEHYRRDHIRESPAVSCPHCGVVYPAKTLLLQHFIQSHSDVEARFPGPCFLCEARGARNVPHMKTAMTFKRHRTAEHLHDWPVRFR